MGQVQKTAVISYRRTNAGWALAVYKDLTEHGYDVFFDFIGIASGDFERVILENIKARAHFLVLLTPSALERVNEPGDWLRREIEFAMQERRNIVPLFLEGFDFGAPAITKQLTGSLADLRRYNGLSVPADYFDAAMERLRSQYLNVSLDAVLHPASSEAVDAAKRHQTAAEAAPNVAVHDLTASEWFERAFDAVDIEEKVRCYSEAIRLKPDYAEAYNNRGIAHQEGGDLDGAVADYSEAIRLKPDFAKAYGNRGIAHQERGDLDSAVADSSEAIRLKPDFAEAYYNRGIAQQERGGLDGAVADYSEAIRLKPDYAKAYNSRGLVRERMADYKAAAEDYQRYLDLGGVPRDGDPAAVEAKIRKLNQR